MGPVYSLLFILAAAGTGAQILRWSGIRIETVAERFCFGAALGLGVAAYGVLALGLAGRMTTAWLVGLVALITTAGARQGLELLRDGGRELIRWGARDRRTADWAALALILFCITLALVTLVPAIAPPTDLDWDGLSYHLAAPKLYLRHHQIRFIAYDSHTNFPFTVEMLYALGLWWGDAGGAKFFHWAAGWLTALAVAAWVQRHLGRDGGPPPAWAAPLAAALWMSIPLAAWEAGTAYVDLGTALFQFLALAALTRALWGEMGGAHQVLSAPMDAGTRPSPAGLPGESDDTDRAAEEGRPAPASGKGWARGADSDLSPGPSPADATRADGEGEPVAGERRPEGVGAGGVVGQSGDLTPGRSPADESVADSDGGGVAGEGGPAACPDLPGAQSQAVGYVLLSPAASPAAESGGGSKAGEESVPALERAVRTVAAADPLAFDGPSKVPPIDLRWAVVAGVLTGFALGTKATALVQFGLLGLALAWVAARSRDRSAWIAVFAFGLAAIAVGSPWYVKSYVWTNNPVYPFFYRFFPRSVHWNPAFDVAYRHEQQSFGRPGHTLFDIFRAPWDLAFHARDFFITTQRTLRWDQWASTGPIAIGFGPLLLYTRRPDRRALAFVGYALASGLFWWFVSQQSRYLMPVFAALAAAAVAVILALPTLALRRGAAGLAAIALCIGLYFAGQMAGNSWWVVSGSASRGEYLNALLPDLYPASQFVNTLPDDSRIALYQETRGFYFDRDYFWANPGQNDLVPYDRLENGDQLADFFHAPGEGHATHVLINLSLSRPDIESGHWVQLLIDAMRRRRLLPVYESRDDGLRTRRGIVVLEVR